VEERIRVLRPIENLTLGSAAVGYLTESMHGAGSPQAQRIMISHLVDLKGKQRRSKMLCGIATEAVGSINCMLMRSHNGPLQYVLCSLPKWRNLSHGLVRAEA